MLAYPSHCFIDHENADHNRWRSISVLFGLTYLQNVGFASISNLQPPTSNPARQPIKTNMVITRPNLPRLADLVWWEVEN